MIHDEGNAVFGAETGTVNAVVVMGELRTGKSTLLNALSERPGAFAVSSGAHSFTQGVDVVSEAAWFGAHKTIFVDMEGQKDKGDGYDVKLATAPLLVSKVIILNVVCPTGPSKVNILQTLAIVIMAAEQVNNRRERKSVFGNLHVVCYACVPFFCRAKSYTACAK